MKGNLLTLWRRKVHQVKAGIMYGFEALPYIMPDYMSADKTKILKSLVSPDEKLLFSRAFDRALLCENKGFITFGPFLDPVKAEKFAVLIEKEINVHVMPCGGAIGCERVMLGFFNDYNTICEEDFPIASLEIKHYNNRLSHRDFLGSILGTGVNRDKVGDIFLFDGKAIALIEREIASFVCGAIDKVANTAVERAIINDPFLIAPFSEGTEKETVVSSMRLDAVISALFNISRGKSVKLIESEKAYVNWQCVKSPSKVVNEGDNITLRGFGRAKIESIGGKTKNDNFRITANTKSSSK